MVFPLWGCGALNALGVFLSATFLLLSLSGSSYLSGKVLFPEPFRKTLIGENNMAQINCSETFDAATEEIIANSFDFPHVDVRKFHSVYTIPGGAISFDADYYQHVLTANMTLIAERSGQWYRGFASLSRNLSKPIVRLFGDVLFLQINCHYWHYQHETIVQLMMLRESGELMALLARKSNSTLLIDAALNCASPNVHGSMLTYYGFDDLLKNMVVHRIDTKVTYQVVGGDLVLTANGCYHPNLQFIQHTAELSTKSRQQLHQREAQAQTTAEPLPPLRLYIDREPGFKRGIVNRDELLKGLAAFNFTLFSPAKRTFTEQREAFSRASLILSPSGTAFSANIVHCDPNTTILIEMFGKPIHTRTGIVVAATMRAQHYYAVQPDYNHNKTSGDFYVNVTMVMMAIRRALSNQRLNITRTALRN